MKRQYRLFLVVYDIDEEGNRVPIQGEIKLDPPPGAPAGTMFYQDVFVDDEDPLAVKTILGLQNRMLEETVDVVALEVAYKNEEE